MDKNLKIAKNLKIMLLLFKNIIQEYYKIYYKYKYEKYKNFFKKLNGNKWKNFDCNIICSICRRYLKYFFRSHLSTLSNK